MSYISVESIILSVRTYGCYEVISTSNTKVAISNAHYYRILIKCKFDEWPHFILGVFNSYVFVSKKKFVKYNELMFYCKILLLLLRWDIGKVM